MANLLDIYSIYSVYSVCIYIYIIYVLHGGIFPSSQNGIQCQHGCICAPIRIKPWSLCTDIHLKVFLCSQYPSLTFMASQWREIFFLDCLYLTRYSMLYLQQILTHNSGGAFCLVN